MSPCPTRRRIRTAYDPRDDAPRAVPPVVFLEPPPPPEGDDGHLDEQETP